MRQALLITAYQDMEQLKRLIDRFDSDFECFIHLDKKCGEAISDIGRRQNVHLMSRYSVEWGDYNHLKAIIMLMAEAYAHGDLEYFHLITGSDYPAMPLADFKRFCEEHREDNYLEHFALPHSEWGREGGLNRIYYWWLRPNAHRTTGAWLTRKLNSLQRRMGVRRSFNYFSGKLYGGGTYWSMSRKAVGKALDYLQRHPGYLRRFRHTSIAEEICLPTLWANSDITLTNNYMRYIDWGADGANPQVLTEKDYANIKASGAFFARKMERGKSDRLMEILDNQ